MAKNTPRVYLFPLADDKDNDCSGRDKYSIQHIK